MLSGTAVYYQPGMLTGGSIQHDCNIQRAIGYYLEALLCLGAFTKKPISATLRGITSDQLDPSVRHMSDISLKCHVLHISPFSLKYLCMKDTFLKLLWNFATLQIIVVLNYSAL